MRRDRNILVPALTAALFWAACASLSGCAAPATPASVAAAQAAAAVPPAIPPTSATTGTTTIVAVQPAAPPPKQCTLCGFLGLDKAGAGIGGLFQRAFSRVKTALGLEGRFPGLQPKPPVLPITDPANLGPTSPPAVKAAAEAKMEEDQASQKIQALRYLATIGCGGCYPGIEEAMLAALDDCTEAVRYEALLALRGDGNTCCAYCRCQSCCSPAVRKKLDELANARDEQGCFREPSERVRRLARTNLAACGGLIVDQETVPSEGPTPAPPLGAPPPPGPTASVDEPSNGLEPAVRLVSFDSPTAPRSTHDPVLARVNGEEISESTLLPLIEAQMAELRARGQVVDPDQIDWLVAEQLRRAIDAKLVVQQARRALAAAGRASAEPLTSEQVDAWLQEALAVDAYVALAELNAFYRSHVHRFQGHGEVRWEQATISTRDAARRDQARATAEYLRTRAAGATDVPTGVDLELVDTTIVPYTTYDQVEPQALVAALKALPVGAASPIIEHRQELFVVRVLDRRPGKLMPLDEALPQIREEIVAERKRAAEAALLARLRSQADIWTAKPGERSGSSTIPAVPPSPVVLPKLPAPGVVPATAVGPSPTVAPPSGMSPPASPIPASVAQAPEKHPLPSLVRPMPRHFEAPTMPSAGERRATALDNPVPSMPVTSASQPVTARPEIIPLPPVDATGNPFGPAAPGYVPPAPAPTFPPPMLP